MELTLLNALSPIDGRYRKQSESLSSYFSEAALISYRVFVEIEYFISLAELPLPQLKGITKQDISNIKDIYLLFSFTDAEEVKRIESTTNHDVKAVEYYLKNKFEKLGLSKYSEFIHFGLTSQDINNTAVPYSLYTAIEEVVIPAIDNIINLLQTQAKEWKQVPMLSHTHGQPASPTTMGKELFVFVERLKTQLKILKTIPKSAKFGGAVGNFNAHFAAYPNIDWNEFGDNFLNKKLNLERQKHTTQIEHYDCMAAHFDSLKRINTIIIDLVRDIWQYISLEYFKQKIKDGEVGSSTMPHKINPIDFENAEGNLGFANAMFVFFAGKLPVSRLQRDLTDSTVSRNFGVAIAHSLIAYKSVVKGLNKLLLNPQKLELDLEANWAVVAEAIQTILRREGYPQPYEALKMLTRTNEAITKESIANFVKTLKVSAKVKKELLNLTPFNYIGIIGF